MPDDIRPRSKGVQSVQTAMAILMVFAEVRGPLTLTEIGQRTGIAPAKVHRYLASLVDAGMIDHRKSGSYDLGRMAAALGTAAIARVDVANRAADCLPELVDRAGCTAMMSVWGTEGPTVVRWERAMPPLVTALGVGTVLPLLTSATGLTFLAWSPDRLMGDALTPENRDEISALRKRIRVDGIAEAKETFIPGLFALAAPVLDLQGQAAAVVTLVSTDRSILEPKSTARAALKEMFPVVRMAVPGSDPADP